MIKVIKSLLKSRNSSQKAGNSEVLSDKVLSVIFLGTVSGGRGGGAIILPKSKI
ncbi:hypothetical protein PCIT_a3248 [Pseudoalteromonas citrea]|uniref:Uncharacterized protein n=1 Tax=Pseudoalteromonas citrea TaxID=43655 RepID=A0AAD4AGM8_9GAMM|nr:hypothetical protein [Pseudoalteromonas citrea]KAF7768754.1 hypothetical protein PCIT_a3248 [Pseudoalteromonas citrea]